ncbi:MAG: anti-sigma factor [Planctomycetota bacterium]|nr:anti-sigma factor [Planctomycetota bacterium]
MMTCLECQSELERYALDENRCADKQAITEHLINCADCRDSVRSLREAWASLAEVLASVPINESLEDRILERVSKIPSSVEKTIPLRGRYARSHILQSRYMVASVVLMGLISYFYLRPASDYPLSRTAEDLVVRELAQRLKHLDEMKQVFASPQLRYVALHSDDGPQPAGAYLVYDPVKNEGHFLAYGLPATGMPQHFVLWLLDVHQEVIHSAVFSRDKQGGGAVSIPFPKDPRRVAIIRVTLESLPNPTVPSDQELLHGGLGEQWLGSG